MKTIFDILKIYLLCSFVHDQGLLCRRKKCISRMCSLVTLTTQLAEHLSMVAAETPGQLPGCLVHQYTALLCYPVPPAFYSSELIFLNNKKTSHTASTEGWHYLQGILTVAREIAVLSIMLSHLIILFLHFVIYGTKLPWYVLGTMKHDQEVDYKMWR